MIHFFLLLLNLCKKNSATFSHSISQSRFYIWWLIYVTYPRDKSLFLLFSLKKKTIFIPLQTLEMPKNITSKAKDESQRKISDCITTEKSQLKIKWNKIAQDEDEDTCNAKSRGLSALSDVKYLSLKPIHFKNCLSEQVPLWLNHDEHYGHDILPLLLFMVQSNRCTKRRAVDLEKRLHYHKMCVCVEIFRK